MFHWLYQFFFLKGSIEKYSKQSKTKRLTMTSISLVPTYLGFPDSSVGKESTCNAGDLGSIPGLGRSPGEGKGYPPQYSYLENCLHCSVHRVPGHD